MSSENNSITIPVRGGQPGCTVDVGDAGNSQRYVSRAVPPFDLEFPQPVSDLLVTIWEGNSQLGQASYSPDSGDGPLSIIRLGSFVRGGISFHCRCQNGCANRPCKGTVPFTDVLSIASNANSAADLTMCNGLIYAVYNNRLHSLVPDLGQPTEIMEGWNSGTILTTLNNTIYAAYDDRLWRIDLEHRERTELAKGWKWTYELAAWNDKLVAVYDGKLWSVDPRFGTSVRIGTDNWSWFGDWSKQRTAVHEGVLYVAHNDRLYQIQSDGSRVEKASGWNYTAGLVSYGKYLYAIYKDVLFRVDPTSGKSEEWRRNFANWGTRLSVLDGRAYYMTDSRILSVVDLTDGTPPSQGSENVEKFGALALE